MATAGLHFAQIRSSRMSRRERSASSEPGRSPKGRGSCRLASPRKPRTLRRSHRTRTASSPQSRRSRSCTSKGSSRNGLKRTCRSRQSRPARGSSMSLAMVRTGSGSLSVDTGDKGVRPSQPSNPTSKTTRNCCDRSSNSLRSEAGRLRTETPLLGLVDLRYRATPACRRAAQQLPSLRIDVPGVIGLEPGKRLDGLHRGELGAVQSARCSSGRLSSFGTNVIPATASPAAPVPVRSRGAGARIAMTVR